MVEITIKPGNKARRPKSACSPERFKVFGVTTAPAPCPRYGHGRKYFDPNAK